MTDRAEIERLLNQTGRTLEGLPEQYASWAALETSRRVGNTSIKVGNMLLHQSDVIELLVGALRDALDKRPKWISVRDKLPKCDIEVLAISSEGTMRVCYYNGDWHGMLNSVDYWMPLPEPPKEDA